MRLCIKIDAKSRLKKRDWLHIQGICIRSVDDLVKALGMTGVSKSQVSRLCGELDERVGAFLSRQIDGDRPWYGWDPLR